MRRQRLVRGVRQRFEQKIGTKRHAPGPDLQAEAHCIFQPLAPAKASQYRWFPRYGPVDPLCLSANYSFPARRLAPPMELGWKICNLRPCRMYDTLRTLPEQS